MPVGPWRNLATSKLGAAALVVILTAGGVLGLRGARLLESVELAAYDWFIRMRPFDPAPDSRILLVTVTEADLQAQGGWPLSDRVLAQTVETLARYQPRAIGLDIYRDVPVPPGRKELDAVLAGDPRVIVVRKFGEGPSDGVPPPAVLKNTDQVGFNDILVDPGGTVRRGLLFMDDGRTTAYSFALRLALLYLQAEGVTARPDETDPRQLRLGRSTIRPFEPNDGAYVRADARGYQFLLDFRPGKGSFPSVSLTSLLSGTIGPEVIRKKVVLVGVTAESVKDLFYTPHSRGLPEQQNVAGLAVHAHVVSQLLRIGLEGASPMAAPTGWQDAVNAVNCALAMEETLLELNRRRRAADKAMTGMRIGIFTGPVVAGTIGSAERSEYVVVGDTMNTASRLESFDKDLFPPDAGTSPCRILIGETTLCHLGDQFETERVGDVSLKGKAHKVGVYRVIGRAQTQSRPLGLEGTSWEP